jgi:hypothetical protein
MTDKPVTLEEAVETVFKLSQLDRVRLVEIVIEDLKENLTESRQERSVSADWPYGMWAGVDISAEDIDEARCEA